MVAYSFKAQFAEPIIALEKRQTVRGLRKRHALPGEAVQLYTAMRTRHCRKLLGHDPICKDVRRIDIIVDGSHPELIASIAIEGVALDDAGTEAFAWDDGFRPMADGSSARHHMGSFWLNSHGNGLFEGVVIRWEPRLG